MCEALREIERHEPDELVAIHQGGGGVVIIEDWADPDGRKYRLEYQSTEDGEHAIAICRYNPWGGKGNPNAGVNYLDGHVAEDGFLCLAESTTRELEESPYDLDFAIRRARFWCTAFSHFKENGSWPDT